MISAARRGQYIGTVPIDQACNIEHWREDRSRENRLKNTSRLFWPTVVASLTNMKSISYGEVLTNDDLIVNGGFSNVLFGKFF